MNYELNKSFFYEHPSKGKWNPEGHYFNITDGKHRAIFQTSMNCCFIPLEISYEDEKEWLNTDAAYELYKKLETGEKDHCRIIDNPYFYRRLSEFRAIDSKVFVSCITLLAEMLFQRYQVIDFSRITVSFDQGHENDYLLINLLRFGCQTANESKKEKASIYFHIGDTATSNSAELCLSSCKLQGFKTIHQYTVIDHGKRHNTYLLKGKRI